MQNTNDYDIFGNLGESGETQAPAEQVGNGQLPVYIFLAEESLETLVSKMNQRTAEGYRLVSELKTVADNSRWPPVPMWTVVMELQEPVAPYIPEIKLALMLYNGEVEVEVENASPINGFEA